MTNKKPNSPDKKTVCVGCSCLCDDLVLTGAGDDLNFATSCPVASHWFQCAKAASAPEPALSESQLNSLIQDAFKALRDSKAPLVTGLNRLTTSAQGKAWELADYTSAIVDIGFSNSGRASTLAFQQFGKVTATMGEVANRADLIVCWFCDPMTTHPRLLERVLKERSSKKLIVFDRHETVTANESDEFIQIPKQHAVDVLKTLRALVAGSKVDVDAASKKTNIAPAKLQSWAKLLTSAKYGTVYFDSRAGSRGDSVDPSFDSPTQQWFQLVRELNNHTRFVMGSLRDDQNGLSAQNVLTSLSGFPFAISYLEGKPNFNGLEYSTTNVLNRGECDSILYFGSAANLTSEADEYLDDAGKRHLKSIPKILIGQASEGEEPLTLSIPTTTPGWNGGGDFVRHDDVAIPLRPIVESTLPDAESILEKLVAVARA